jgi:hypothetical protein
MAGCAGIGNMAGCAGIGNMADCAGIGNMADCVGGWMADCVGGWMADCVGGWMADCVGGWIRYTAKIAAPCISCRQTLPVSRCQSEAFTCLCGFPGVKRLAHLMHE